MLPTTSKWFSYFVCEVLDRQSVCCCITGEEAGKEKEKVTSMENQIAKAHNLVESIYDKTFWLLALLSPCHVLIILIAYD